MAGVLKTLFDLSLYYTLTGFYLRCVSGQAPSAICFLALVLCAALDAFLRARGVKSRFLRFLPLLLPFLSLFARPGLIPFLHCVPAWAYAAFSILTQRLDMRYDGFHRHNGLELEAIGKRGRRSETVEDNSRSDHIEVGVGVILDCSRVGAMRYIKGNVIFF